MCVKASALPLPGLRLAWSLHQVCGLLVLVLLHVMCLFFPLSAFKVTSLSLAFITLNMTCLGVTLVCLLCCGCLLTSVVFDSVRPCGLQPANLLCIHLNPFEFESVPWCLYL